MLSVVTGPSSGPKELRSKKNTCKVEKSSKKHTYTHAVLNEFFNLTSYIYYLSHYFDCKITYT